MKHPNPTPQSLATARFRYFLIATSLFLVALAVLIMLGSKMAFNEIANALGIVIVPLAVLLLFLVLLLLAVYFFSKGRKAGRAKNHIRFR